MDKNIDLDGGSGVIGTQWDDVLFWIWMDSGIFCDDDQSGVVINECCKHMLWT